MPVRAVASGMQIAALAVLCGTVKALMHPERTVGELPATPETEQAIARVEQAVGTIRRALQVRG